MKTRLTTGVVMAVASAVTGATDYIDTAQVISSAPIIERVTEPRQECTTSTAPTPQPQERSVVAPVIGGVAGAILGSQVGRGRGRDAAAAVGAVAGSIVGDRVANPDSTRSVTGAVVGGAAGGVMGAQVGSGEGRTAATAAGAIAGSVIGDRVDNRQTAAAQPVQRCRTVETIRDMVKGYTVVYRYNGRDITTTLPYDPGRTVRVGIGVIDEGRNATVPTASRMGSNVREVNQAVPADAAPAGAPSSGNYTYRY